jgi:LPXTG-site transpeptidase (sortase) family protein
MRFRYTLITVALCLLAACLLAACRPAGPARLAASATPAPVALAPTFTATASPGARSYTPTAVEPTPPPATPFSGAQATGTPSALPTPSPEPSPNATPDVPPRLLIPKLKIDKEIVTVPVVKGDWDLTKLGDGVGRLETTGQAPGDALAMAIAGHITTSIVQLGPFANIWKLRAGDAVILRSGATDYLYTVQTKRTALPEATRLLYVEDGRRLLLVTCSEWDTLTQTWSRRLIVEAELTGQQPAP